MIDEEIIVKQFASFCRKILKCEKIDYYRERKYRAECELYLELFEEYEVERLIQTSDTYGFDWFEVMGYEIFVDNEYLVQALRKLPERYLKIILIYYFIGLNDVEIGRVFGKVRSINCEQRHRAIKMLYDFMESAENE